MDQNFSFCISPRLDTYSGMWFLTGLEYVEMDLIVLRKRNDNTYIEIPQSRMLSMSHTDPYESGKKHCFKNE